MMKTGLLFLTIFAHALIAGAADKPVVYNHINPESTEVDPLVNAALSPKYKVVDIQNPGAYFQPKFISGHRSRAAKTEAGEPLGGYVLIAYVVSAEGRVADPVALKSDDERLSAIAMKEIGEWRFVPGKLDDVAIPTTAAQEFTYETSPTEFVQQVLEPTGGKIERPKDWFYAERHGGPTYMWTLSREDASKGKNYTTGVRIQTFFKVKEGTGKTAKEFIHGFAEEKKKTADKVLKTCEPKDQGLFTRICLETEEGPYHILYSLFWGSKDLDIAVVVISGTTKELWETYAPTFDKMGAFELIDMKRFDK